jgi:hypothetical protein
MHSTFCSPTQRIEYLEYISLELRIVTLTLEKCIVRLRVGESSSGKLVLIGRIL